MTEKLHVTRWEDGKCRHFRVSLPEDARQPVRVWTIEGDNRLEDITLFPGDSKTLIDGPTVRIFAQLEYTALSPEGVVEIF